MTQTYEVGNYHHGPKSLGQSIFQEQSLRILDLEPSHETFFVLEILGKPCNPKLLFIEKQIEGDGNGYSLSLEDELEKN